MCIIPVSAHGTNPASAAMCGMKIVTVGTDAHGNVDIAELRQAAEKHKDNLSALMVSAGCYPCGDVFWLGSSVCEGLGQGRLNDCVVLRLREARMWWWCNALIVWRSS